MDLPSFIPIFPLPNVVLFPEVPLPLHIFEHRYRSMVRDAIAGSGLIGMVLLRDGWESEYHAAPDVYRVGCVGKIVETTPLPDGKFNIVLAGLREFEIVSEQRERLYRQASVVWRPDPVDGPDAPLPGTLRRDLVRTIERYTGRAGDEETRELLGDAALSDETLVNFFAFWLDLTPVEKQCLVEEAGGAARARRLLEILEFHLYAARRGELEPGMRRMH
jgi:Lon protease-like protein